MGYEIMQYFVNVAILVSHVVNVLFFAGSPYQMLCSRCYENHRESRFWFYLMVFFDNLWPLSVWTTPGMKHCESCYYQEKNRCRNHSKMRFENAGKSERCCN